MADVKPEEAVKVEDSVTEPAEGGSDAAAAPDAQAGTKRAAPEPVQLGYASFKDAGSAKRYFSTLLSSWAKQLDCNEYEYRALLDLLKHHPDAPRKLGPGVKAFQVRKYSAGGRGGGGYEGGSGGKETRAFFALRKDGSVEDFSYLKCLATIFPGEVSQPGGGSGGGDGKRARK